MVTERGGEGVHARRALLVAMAGGHLSQLLMLLPRLPVDPDRSVWVSVQTPQSVSELQGRTVLWVPYVQPRDLRGALSHWVSARQLLRRERFDVSVSTGSAVAVPFLTAAALHGVPTHYIESATRVTGPSMSGRLLSAIPGVRTYTQYEHWQDRRWLFRGSVFDGFAAQPRSGPTPIRRAVVTIGSAKDFPFRRLVEAAVRALPADCEVTWQTGSTDLSGLPVHGRDAIPAAELQAAIAAADVVVAHAGTGSALTALQLGKVPVLVPRDHARGEHVDDHQQQIARELRRRGLAVVVDPDELDDDALTAAAGLEARRVTPPAFRLEG